MLKKSVKGMTLLEVIIAMAMLSIILVAFLGAYTSGFEWIYDSGFRTQDNFTDQQALDTALGYMDVAGVAVVEGTLTIRINGSDYDVSGDRLSIGSFNAFRPD